MVLRFVLIFSNDCLLTIISFRLDTRNNDHSNLINQGDVQLELILVNTQLYKTRPLYAKQRQISKYMNHRRIADWSGKYFAFKKEVAESYGSGYLTDGKGGYYSKTYKVKESFHILNIKKRAFADGRISQENKAKALKDFFRANGLGQIQHQEFYYRGISDNDDKKRKFDAISRDLKRYLNNMNPSLATVLNNVGVALSCPHDEKNNELILPSAYEEAKVLNEIHSEVVVPDSRVGGETGRFANLAAVNGLYKGIIDGQKRKIDREDTDNSLVIVD